MRSRSQAFSVLTATLFSLILPQIGLAGSAIWNANPVSGDWSNAANWTPNTVPNGPNDVATFATSSQTDVVMGFTDRIELDSIVFQPGASAFLLRVRNGATLTLSGAGVVNNSGLTQNFVSAVGTYVPIMYFRNSASAGTLTSYEIGAYTNLYMYDSSSAGSANFIIDAGPSGSFGGVAEFRDQSTGGNATITAAGANVANGGAGYVTFEYTSSADHATLIANAATGARAYSGAITFTESSQAGQAILIANGGNAGVNSVGTIAFRDFSSGESARVELSGKAMLDVSYHNREGALIGSIEGDGFVYLGNFGGIIPITVGSNNLSTTLSGVIRGNGSFTKTGTGVLTLTAASTYTEGTVVEGGRLLAENRNGSATGSGSVQVNAGVLGGRGIISGAVTLGTGGGVGAYLAPGKTKTKPATLTLQANVTFNSDGIYACDLNSNSATADKVTANGVTINAGASFSIFDSGTATLTPGMVFTVIDNTAATTIAGTFSNLADGGTVRVGNNTFQANYEGGNGNDLTLTVVQ